MKIIGFTGHKKAGKDTSVEPLVEDGVYQVVKFADPLKNMLRSLFRDAGIDAVTIERMIEGDLKQTPTPALQGKTPRYAMETLGTEWRDLLGKNLWTDITDLKIKACARGGTSGVVVTDLRFPHEESYLRKIGAYLVRITGLSDERSGHASEEHIDVMDVDAEVFNFGEIEPLQTAVLNLSAKVNNSNV